MKKRIFLCLAVTAISLLLTGCIFQPSFKAGEIDGTYVMKINHPANELAVAYDAAYMKLTISGTTGTLALSSASYLFNCEQWAKLRKMNLDAGDFPEPEWAEPFLNLSVEYDNPKTNCNLYLFADDNFLSGGSTIHSAVSKDKKTITLYTADSAGNYTALVFEKQ
ncbi:MAG: hypothetical protein KBT02_06430 [Treponema sp.]|nr:hypothetical protein [Candidatus Treponema caballi]